MKTSKYSVPISDIALCQRAYKTLVRYNINSLPIDVGCARHISFDSLQSFARHRKLPLKNIKNILGVHGFVVYFVDTDNYFACINTEESEAMLRWSIAVAIAAIELKHPDIYTGGYKLTSPDVATEKFAQTYLCPDIVLDKCHILSPWEIQDACQIPRQKAIAKYKTMSTKKLVLSDALGENILKRFKDYIDKYTKEKTYKE